MCVRACACGVLYCVAGVITMVTCVLMSGESVYIIFIIQGHVIAEVVKLTVYDYAFNTF